VISQRLQSDFPSIAQRLRSDCAAILELISQYFRSDCNLTTVISKRMRSDFAAIKG
jgi:hypothetical protein